MKAELLYVMGCANVALARARLAEASRETRVALDLIERVVTDEAQAAALGMRGSPTILIGGRDVVDAGGEPGSLSCRLYPTSHGYQGAPSVADLAAAVAR